MFDALVSEARTALNAASPEQLAGAAQTHVAQANPADLAQRAAQGAASMDASQLVTLVQSLLTALGRHADEPGVANTLREGLVAAVKSDPQIVTKLPGMVEGVVGALRG